MKKIIGVLLAVCIAMTLTGSLAAVPTDYTIEQKLEGQVTSSGLRGSVSLTASGDKAPFSLDEETWALIGRIAGSIGIDFESTVRLPAFPDRSAAVIIKKDGTIWGAGNNKRGQLGLGEETSSFDAWTEITTISDVASFALGEEFTLALKNDGTVWSVGRNNRGQLGSGSEEKTVYEWTQIADDCKAVLAGVETGGFVKNDGTLWMFGLNDCGQIGNGEKGNLSTPVQVLDDVVMADAGQSHGVALKSDGSIWVWGQNKYYQLCDGTTTDCYTPKQVVTNK